MILIRSVRLVTCVVLKILFMVNRCVLCRLLWFGLVTLLLNCRLVLRRRCCRLLCCLTCWMVIISTRCRLLMRPWRRMAVPCRPRNISLTIMFTGMGAVMSRRIRALCRLFSMKVCMRLSCLISALRNGIRLITLRRTVDSRVGLLLLRRMVRLNGLLVRRRLIGRFVSTLRFMIGLVACCCRLGLCV